MVRQVRDGEWIKPIYDGYAMECCGCGMKHRLEFRVTLPGPGLQMRGWRVEDEKDDGQK